MLQNHALGLTKLYIKSGTHCVTSMRPGKGASRTTTLSGLLQRVVFGQAYLEDHETQQLRRLFNKVSIVYSSKQL